MRTLLARLLFLSGLALLLAGCASFDTQMDSGRSLKKVQHFFVVSNLNDNRAIDRLIAEALKAHGRTAEVGPLTMMPDDTQAVITFADHWNWDFGEHLYFLKLAVRDPSKEQAYASVTYEASVPRHEKTAVTVNHLVEALLDK